MTDYDKQKLEFIAQFNKVVSHMDKYPQGWGQFDFAIITSSTTSDNIYIETDCTGSDPFIHMIDAILVHCTKSNPRIAAEILKTVVEIYKARIEYSQMKKSEMH